MEDSEAGSHVESWRAVFAEYGMFLNHGFFWLENIEGSQDISIVFEFFLMDTTQDSYFFNAFTGQCDPPP